MIIEMLGCGKMGGAILSAWLENGHDVDDIYVQDPNPSEWLMASGVHVNEAPKNKPDVFLLAIKPQMVEEILPAYQGYGGGETIVVSIAAGVKINKISEILGQDTPIIRLMPNTPATIGMGMTALSRNDKVSDEQFTAVTRLFDVIGETVAVDESQLDAVTGVSGSGPAYVFLLIESMALAGQRQGLSVEVALQLAKQTVAGAGMLALADTEHPSDLRKNVTSPNGTTAAALDILMADEALETLVDKAVNAAVVRSIELG